jgi:deubiquitinase DESI2
VFHGGIEIYGKEWSFGLTEAAGVTGVYPVSPTQNPMYEYREAVVLGTTALTPAEVDALVTRLKGEWAGDSYSLLTRNCVHFCEAFAAGLGVGPLPAWVNSLAGGAQAVGTAARAAAAKAKEASSRVAGWVQAAAAQAGGGGGSGNGSAGGSGSGAQR